MALKKPTSRKRSKKTTSRTTTKKTTKKRPAKKLAKRPPKPPSALKAARTELAAYSGLGKSAIAVAFRRQRVFGALLRNESQTEIAARFGLTETYVRKTAQALREEFEDRVSSWDLLQDAAAQVALYDHLRAAALRQLDRWAGHPLAWNRTFTNVLRLESQRQRFLERAGLRKDIQLGKPPDIEDLRGSSTEVLEDELRVLVLHIAARARPGGWMKLVDQMVASDLVGDDELALLEDPEALEVPAK